MISIIKGFKFYIIQFIFAIISNLIIAIFKNSILFPILIYFNYILLSIIFSKNMKEFLILVTFSFMLLDYEKYFSFTSFNIRLWYFSLFFLIPFLFKKYTSIIWIFLFGIIYLFLISIIKGGILDFFKYLIYILTFISINTILNQSKISHFNLVKILLTPIYFTYIQYIFFFVLKINTFLWDPLRPSAFFSESTWFGAYCLLLLFFLFILYKTSQVKNNFFLINLILILILLLFTFSINSYIGLIFFVLGFLYYQKTRIKIYFLFLFSGLLFFFILPLFLIRFSSNTNDLSIIGRIEGFKILFNHFQNKNIFGNGFLFDYNNDVIFSGAAIGSKAFSFPFQLYHIGGLLILFLYFYLSFFNLKYLYRVNNFIIFYLLLSYLTLSFFAPLAQGIIGYFFILLILQYKYEKKLFKIDL